MSVVKSGENVAELGGPGLAGGRQNDSASQTTKEWSADVPFEQFDLMAYRGLGDR